MIASVTGDRAVVRISDTNPRPELLEELSGPVYEVASTGLTGLEPLVAVSHEGRTAFHARCSPERVRQISSACLDGPDVTAADPDGVVEHEPATPNQPLRELAGLEAATFDVLGGCGWRRPTSPADHEAAGGFPDADRAAVFEVGGELAGRGWGDWCHDERPADTWHTAAEAAGDVTVVVNGHGTAADELLLSSVPLEVLDGATALADALGTTRVVVYVSGDATGALERVREAAERYPDPAATVEAVAGKPVYRAAEPTMALEDIEGNHRLEARLRPPGPESFGLQGEPTVVHTPRTLAQLAVALRDGLPETRVVTVEGDVAAPATVELPETGTLDRAIDAVELENGLKAACVGGRFGGVTPSLDVGVGGEALTAAGLGTEGTVHVLSEERCVLEFVGTRARFAADVNCGRCVPCREGTTQLVELLRDIYEGEYDQRKIGELTGVMAETSLCEFGVAAGRPARTAMEAFGAEFEAHAEGRCPDGNCIRPMEAHQ